MCATFPPAELMDTGGLRVPKRSPVQGHACRQHPHGAPRCDATRRWRAAAQAAQCDDIIAKFPEGLCTRWWASDGRVPVGRRVPAHRARPCHPEGRARGGARRGHGLRRPGERGAHPAGAWRRSGRGQDGAHDRASALHGGGRRPHRRGGRRRRVVERGTARRARGGRRPVRAAVGQLPHGQPSGRSKEAAPMLRDASGPDRARCASLQAGRGGAAPWPTSCSWLPVGRCSIW